MQTELSREIRYRLLTHLAAHPAATQRELARELGISVGKVNWCVHALIEKGFVKARNFKNSRNKLAYAYYLTPKGAAEKINVAYEFLRHKLREHAALTEEIAHLRAEVAALTGDAALPRTD